MDYDVQQVVDASMPLGLDFKILYYTVRIVQQHLKRMSLFSEFLSLFLYLIAICRGFSNSDSSEIWPL